MKKWIMPFITAIFMVVLALGVSAASLTYSDEYADGIYSFVARNNSGLAPEGYAYIAVKNSDGVLKKVEKVTLKWVSNVFICERNIALDEGDTIKTFIWDEKMNALLSYDINPAENTVTELKTVNFESYSNGRMYFYEDEYSSSTVSYKLDEGAVFYVNGVELPYLNEDVFETYIMNNHESETVILTDLVHDGHLTTDGYYDRIDVKYLVDAIFDYSMDREDAVRVSFESYSSGINSPYMDVTEDNCKFIKNGEEISVSDLVQGDVLSIAFDVSEGFKNSEFYTVYVNDTTVEGQCLAIGNNDFGDTFYRFNGKDYYFNSDFETQIALGKKYELSLDYYGDIVKTKENVDIANIAIVDRFFISAGDPKVRLIKSDGSKVDYLLKYDSDKTGLSDVMYINTPYPLLDENGYIITANDPENGEITTLDRFVTYKESALGECILSPFTSLNVLTHKYDASTQKIGNQKISDVILNASLYAVDTTETLGMAEAEDFVSETEYTVIFAGTKDSNGKYPLMIVLSGLETVDDFGNSSVVETGTAIVDRFFTSAGDPKVRLIKSDGSKDDHLLKYDSDKTGLSDVMYINTPYPLLDENGDIITANNPKNGEITTLDRFVTYEIRANDECIIKPLTDAVITTGTYNAEENKIGSYVLAGDAVILDTSAYAIDPSDTIYTQSSFKDGLEYTAVLSNVKDGKYTVATKLTSDCGYTVHSQMAVLENIVYTMRDGIDCYKFIVYENGEKKELLTEDDAVDVFDLISGDAFVYSTTPDGYVNEVTKISELFVKDVTKDSSNTLDAIANNSAITDMTKSIVFNGGDVEFVLAPIISVSDSEITLAEVMSDYTSEAEGISYEFADEVNAYRYRDGELDLIEAKDISKSIIYSNGYTDRTKEVIDWSCEDTEINYAIIRVVNGEAADVYAIDCGLTDYVPTEIYAINYAGVDTDSNKIYFYVNETSSKKVSYKLNEEAILVVNGEEAGDISEFDYLCEDFLVNNRRNQKVDFWDYNNDGYIDYIMVDYFATATVSEVTQTSSKISRINFKNSTNGIGGYLNVNKGNEDISYKFIKNRKEIDASELKENDVLSIKYNVLSDFNNSYFYVVYVSDSNFESKCIAMGNDGHDNFFTIFEDGKEYYWVPELEDNIVTGSKYKIYLDYFGDIAMREFIESAENYAIVDRFFTSAGDNKVRLILADGTKVDYTLRYDSDKTGISEIMEVNRFYPLLNENGEIIEYSDYENIATVDRFVKYSVNDLNEVILHSITGVDDEVKINAVQDEYSALTGKVGKYAIGDNAVILEAASYAQDTMEKVSISSKDKLMDGMDYTAVFAGDVNSDGKYPFVVLLTGNFGYTINSRMTVAAGNILYIYDNETEKYSIPVYDETGNIVNIVTEDDSVDVGSIGKGTPFIYSINSDGEIDDIRVLLERSPQTMSTYEMFEYCGEINPGVAFKGASSPVEFYLYPVIKKYSSSVELATDFEPYEMISSDTGESFSYDTDIKVYVYNSDNFKNPVSFGKGSSVVASSISWNGRVYYDDTLVDWSSDNNIPAFALVRVYEGDIQEIYSISMDY